MFKLSLVHNYRRDSFCQIINEKLQTRKGVLKREGIDQFPCKRILVVQNIQICAFHWFISFFNLLFSVTTGLVYSSKIISLVTLSKKLVKFKKSVIFCENPIFSLNYTNVQCDVKFLTKNIRKVFYFLTDYDIAFDQEVFFETFPGVDGEK